jgi:hypothetical protein
MTEQTLPAMLDIVPNQSARAYLAADLIESQAIKALSIKTSMRYINKVENSKYIPVWIYCFLSLIAGIDVCLIFYWDVLTFLT